MYLENVVSRNADSVERVTRQHGDSLLLADDTNSPYLKECCNGNATTRGEVARPLNWERMGYARAPHF